MLNKKLSKEPLKIVTWNSNHIFSNLPEFQQFIIDNSPYIIAIQEAFLQPANFLNFANYTTYRTDRTSHRGGDSIEPNKPPYYPVNQFNQLSTIDLGLAKGIQNISDSTSEDHSSDHNPVYFLVGLDNTTPQPQNQILLTNWSKFNQNLSNTMIVNPPINDLNELDKAIDNFELSI
ncbi:hypothetical protein NPIL_336301 [Nephila pilipes]|uniref:Endonuclease/exonuclease/phosphatase domain-containing protein n=1 Tax=Nephila pilipes TaxID=299642 RepID=A0A8X6TLH5_NEPPI|nr:hypothetical protein NPIL_336301 [Nephila pilipes]